MNEMEYPSKTWVPIEQIDEVQVEYIGRSKRKAGVVLASFNAA